MSKCCAGASLRGREDGSGTGDNGGREGKQKDTLPWLHFCSGGRGLGREKGSQSSLADLGRPLPTCGTEILKRRFYI